MILGTPRRWWIAAAVPFVLAIALFATGAGGALGTAGGVALLLIAIGLFAAAPMRYGRDKRSAPAESGDEATPTVTAGQTPQPRPSIEARDASDV